MPSLTANVQPNGLIVQLGILVSIPRRLALQASGAPVPQPVLANGRIDTGASCTAVDPNVIARLGITPTGAAQILTPSTGSAPHVCNQYDIAIAVLLGTEFKIIDNLPVIEAALSHHGFEVLIGRDVLSQGLLIYNGPDASLTIWF